MTSQGPHTCVRAFFFLPSQREGPGVGSSGHHRNPQKTTGVPSGRRSQDSILIIPSFAALAPDKSSGAGVLRRAAVTGEALLNSSSTLVHLLCKVGPCQPSPVTVPGRRRAFPRTVARGSPPGSDTCPLRSSRPIPSLLGRGSLAFDAGIQGAINCSIAHIQGRCHKVLRSPNPQGSENAAECHPHRAIGLPPDAINRKRGEQSAYKFTRALIARKGDATVIHSSNSSKAPFAASWSRYFWKSLILYDRKQNA